MVGIGRGEHVSFLRQARYWAATEAVPGAASQRGVRTGSDFSAKFAHATHSATVPPRGCAPFAGGLVLRCEAARFFSETAQLYDIRSDAQCAECCAAWFADNAGFPTLGCERGLYYASTRVHVVG